MTSIMIIGLPGSGKTAVSLGLAHKLRDEGRRTGYYKPVGLSLGPSDRTDEDGVLLKSVLNMPEDLDTIVPFYASASYLLHLKAPETYCQKVRENYYSLANNYDVMLIGGAPNPFFLASVGLDVASMALELQARALVVARLEDDYSLDRAIFLCDCLKARGVTLMGLILNQVPRRLLDKTRGLYEPILRGRDLQVLGVIPSQLEIGYPTVAEFKEALGAEILAGDEHLDRIVEETIVGAMTIESAISYLRRAPNKAVVTGGDRADLALAALETSTSVLVLTGGLYPDVRVLAQAADKGVPVLLVHEDTFAAVDKLHRVSRRIRPGDAQAIRLAEELFADNCNWPEILSSLER